MPSSSLPSIETTIPKVGRPLIRPNETPKTRSERVKDENRRRSKNYRDRVRENKKKLTQKLLSTSSHNDDPEPTSPIFGLRAAGLTLNVHHEHAEAFQAVVDTNVHEEDHESDDAGPPSSSLVDHPFAQAPSQISSFAYNETGASGDPTSYSDASSISSDSEQSTHQGSNSRTPPSSNGDENEHLNEDENENENQNQNDEENDEGPMQYHDLPLLTTFSSTLPVRINEPSSAVNSHKANNILEEPFRSPAPISITPEDRKRSQSMLNRNSAHTFFRKRQNCITSQPSLKRYPETSHRDDAFKKYCETAVSRSLEYDNRPLPSLISGSPIATPSSIRSSRNQHPSITTPLHIRLLQAPVEARRSIIDKAYSSPASKIDNSLAARTQEWEEFVSLSTSQSPSTKNITFLDLTTESPLTASSIKQSSRTNNLQAIQPRRTLQRNMTREAPTSAILHSTIAMQKILSSPAATHRREPLKSRPTKDSHISGHSLIQDNSAMDDEDRDPLDAIGCSPNYPQSSPARQSTPRPTSRDAQIPENSLFDPRPNVNIDHSDDLDPNPDVELRELRRKAAKKIYDQHVHFPGCPGGKHEAELHRHLRQAGSNHNDLSATYQSGRHDRMPLESGSMIQHDKAQRVDINYLRSTIHGQTGETSRPPNICLHKETTAPATPQRKTDQDSVLGFASSLECAIEGIDWIPSTMPTRNVNNNLHIPLPENPHAPACGQKDVQIRFTPHFHFGQIVGFPDMSLYFVFPNLFVKGKDFNSLTYLQHSRFHDLVLWPAIKATYDSDYTQHLHASYKSNYQRTFAAKTEPRVRKTDTYQSRQLLYRHLAPSRLGYLWQRIQENIRDGVGLGDFDDVQLFFTAKDLKLRFKPQCSYQSTIESPAITCRRFWNRFVRAIDLDHVYRHHLYVDQGMETCVQTNPTGARTTDPPPQAQTYLYRKCCLEYLLKWLYNDTNAKGVNEFHQYGFLRDAANLTTIPPESSLLMRAGARKIHFYANCKGTTDVAKYFSFGNEGQEAMALDPRVRAAAAHTARSQDFSQDALETGFIAGKGRLSQAFLDARTESYGLRQEYRMVWDLFEAFMLEAEQRERNNPDEWKHVLSEHPNYAWPVASANWFSFLWNGANKFIYMFEAVQASVEKNRMTWDHTQIMATALRCLRFVTVGVNLSKHPALWWDKVDGEHKTTGEPITAHGFGFQKTMRQCGYCWLAPRFDWNTLCVKERYENTLLIANRLIFQTYRKHRLALTNLSDHQSSMHNCAKWLKRYPRPNCQRLIHEFMIHIILQQYRYDVYAELEKDAKRENYRLGVTQEDFRLCHRVIQATIGQAPILHGVNRNGNKIPDFQCLYSILFTNDRIKKSQGQRKHWGHQKGYRALLQMGRSIYESGSSSPLSEDWDSLFQKQLVRYNWMFLVPDLFAGCFVKIAERADVGRGRPWFSLVRWRKNRPGHGVPIEGYVWDKATAPNPNQPDPLPSFLGWNRTTWGKQLEGLREPS